ncbi:MAG TPA: NUDIX hydrolase [Bryobacteraceae bacterium]|nr:NUDIX hydrolase [Bryobacteraceae bacterium]
MPSRPSALTSGKNPWKTIASRIAYQNPWIRVREDQVLRPDGKPGIYGVVEIPPSVGVVALNERDEIALVGQWRYTLNRYSWEIPRGGSEGHPHPLDVAKRELAEEAGVQAEQWQALGVVDVCNGVTDDVQHLFLATGIRETRAHQDPSEEIVVDWKPLAQAVEMALAGEISEVCSVAAILMVERRRRS